MTRLPRWVGVPCLLAASINLAHGATTDAQCQRTLTADVVAFNQPYFYNRLGAVAPTGQIFALRGDVVDANGKFLDQGGSAIAGQVHLREDKRPRPLTLRMNVGDCLEVHFQNLLDPDRENVSGGEDLPSDRHVGIAVTGLNAVNSITDIGMAVGANQDATVAPGDSRTYTFHAEGEGGYLLYDGAVTWAGESTSGSRSHGLFGAVNVQPVGADYLRSKVTQADLALATSGYNDSGHPIIDYDALYPNEEPWISKGLAGRPVLRMLDAYGELVHSDLEAIIVGPDDGNFPASAYAQANNPSLPNRLEPYREFTTIFHDEVKAVQAFPGFFEDPVFGFTLESVRDSFAVNYGIGGIGSVVLANRIGVGPMHDCLGCKYEDFFLSSYVVGDPAMVVDMPANVGLEDLAPGDIHQVDEALLGPKASKALYPDDPSNVHHSYIGDFTKFRNLHVGHEHHMFHLHAHQWLFNSEDDGSAYLDSQAIGPGSSYTYEIAFGGSGNRNRTPGDAIYHCHFYPHFAQGMYGHWRNHDVLELGTELDENGRPLPGSRAYPDGEILVGTPIPAVVPIPGKPMPPMPGRVEVVAVDIDNDGKHDSSQARVIDRDLNPGFPFYIAGIEDTVGQRGTTPPLALEEDGGLPRHILRGYTAGGEAVSTENRWDMSKAVEVADAMFFDEAGTDVERVAMAFHARRFHDSYLPNGFPATGEQGFRTNGAPPTPGAPFADPCVDDRGIRLDEDNLSPWFIGNTLYNSPYNADNPRHYRAADIRMDMVLNKVGWHFPQQNLRVLNEDVAATLNQQRPPEPLTIRLNSFDCALYHHTNLLPFEYELDDFQVRTPTDITSSHIHLVKFDVTASDGAANGWNYESGALSPQEVYERIHAIRRFNNCIGLDGGDPRDDTWQCPTAASHSYFAGIPEVSDMASGARTTVQRWFADPIINNQGVDRTLGTVFFHDHFGPSTHQQTGLYSSMLVQPARSQWVHNETGEPMYTRNDGGPTSWQAAILPGDGSEPHREFSLQIADFQHAYEAGRGVDNQGRPVPDFAGAINPPLREPTDPLFPETVRSPNTCPGGAPRPCPEAVSSFDPGTYVVNYRNEPVGLRIYDPERIGADGKRGWQADGQPGDLAFAFSSKVSRRIPELNDALGASPYPALTLDRGDRDPFTPMMRTLAGDTIKLRVQASAHEEEHNLTINGMRWLNDMGNPASGWRNSQILGISEQFNVQTPTIAAFRQDGDQADYLWNMNANNDGIWNGIWGLVRAYNKPRQDIYKLPNSRVPLMVGNPSQYDNMCPVYAPVREMEIQAVTAGDVLPPLRDANGATIVGGNPFGDDRGTLVYNARETEIDGKRGPLHDPSALLYVLTEDLEPIDAQHNECRADKGGTSNPRCPVRLRPERNIEPLVVRANAGECLDVTLINRLPEEMVDIDGFTTAPAIVNRDFNPNRGKTTFQLNMVLPSSEVGLRPQLLSYDVTRSDGMNVGQNPEQTVSPGESRTYRWYAGTQDLVKGVTPGVGNGKGKGEAGNQGGSVGGYIGMSSTAAEFGATNLMPADPIQGNEKGLVGALIIQPEGATWQEDPGTRTAATVTQVDGSQYRDFAVVAQLALNWLYADGTPVPHIDTEGGVPSDPKDSGHHGINYRSEPIWFRYGFKPDLDLGEQNSVVDNHRLAHSNQLTAGQDPETPVFQAAAGMPTRFRLVNPGGNSRNWVFEIAGHSWQRHPYEPGSWSRKIGDNPYTFRRGAQEGIGASAHWDFVLESAGGPFAVQGDYLYRDNGSFGDFKGGWGIFRVTEPGQATVTPPSTDPAPTPYPAPGNSGNAPGNSGNAPGNSGNASGNSGAAPGNSGAAPGGGKGKGAKA
ncbi:hypothetical protein [Halomonas urumqiensis]|uniref:hypothetical protein n=1 Tax=Halomonas urumqiensis TaxID=1684789 RepID=UPI0015E152DA|nr:hypothetical protein [Halomonas urumqiensis]GHE20906.1 multicopper oxidase [Halomonas urumqiensis]